MKKRKIKFINKSILTLSLVILSYGAVWACEVCKQNQPKALQNITHGTGPQSDWDYVIICSGIIIVGLTLFYSLKFLIRPGENQPDHIKNIVLTHQSKNYNTDLS